jgi:hypothetical protein
VVLTHLVVLGFIPGAGGATVVIGDVIESSAPSLNPRRRAVTLNAVRMAASLNPGRRAFTLNPVQAAVSLNSRRTVENI